MSAVDVLVTLLLAGLALRSAIRLWQLRDRSAELLPACEESPLRTTQEAARLVEVEGVPGVVYEYRGKFDRKRMVQMLREQGYVDEAGARELLRDA